MSYRDDHAAALARIDALEKELAAAREEGVAASHLLARSERERARLSAELERERTRSVGPATSRKTGPLPVDADRVPSGRRLQTPDPRIAVVLGGVVLLSLIVGLVARSLM